MIIKDKTARVDALQFASAHKAEVFAAPKKPYVAAVRALAEIIPDLEADFDPLGQLRCLSTSDSLGLYKQHVKANPAFTAHRFLSDPMIKSAFGLRHVELLPGKTSTLAFGHRVDFEQVSELWDIEGNIPVHGGAVSVFIDKTGRLFSVTSSLRRGRNPVQAGRIISKSTALKLAALRFHHRVDAANCRLVLFSHKGRMDVAYEITLESNKPRDIMGYLVRAKTGEIVHQQFKLLRCCAASVGRAAHASALLCTPDPYKPITPQVSNVIIEQLSDPKILANKHFAMFVGSEYKAVTAKEDGSYCYGVTDPEFAAVSVFITLNRQLEFYAELGMKPLPRTVPVFVDDPLVSNNAYFDPVHFSMHIGVGSGLRRGGLNKHIAFDLGVSNHEFGHNAVFLQTPGNDLPGAEGAAMHEATGDVLGTLVMDYLSRISLAGEMFTAADIARDKRIIGKYVLPPHGIRRQQNAMRTPDDLTGDPHDDGMIAGGAFADVLVGMCTQPKTVLEEQIRLFAKINLTALALVPMHKVTFRDMLRAFLLADCLDANSLHRSLIEQSFANHGIALGAYAKSLALAA